MPATEADLFALLARLGIATRTVRHRPVFTVEEAQSVRDNLPGGHTKNLFLKDKKGALWLVVAEETAAVDLKTLPARIGAGRLSFANATALKDVLGIAPGSVSPFALINDTAHVVRLVLDARLMRLDPLNFHPLDNSATTAIAANDLLAFLAALGVQPLILDLGSDGTDGRP
ncbi:DNA-binding protein [Candidatus Defluviicoccus seviourii]|uniref:DNA-binding protein n=2 Tax=root TaxID=1 RepID=A0A564WF93_9PROT|nr:DNA-binding protein [uncultured Defluviicoccus sp.]VUX46951.1 DNA-binding protein [Candidatus Defluviicoccus seviourii]